MISPVTADDPAPIQGTSMISIFAPAGIGEVVAGTDLATAIITAAEADPHGPLQDGDIVVITSKIISKAEGRIEPASQRAELITSESRRTVARRAVDATGVKIDWEIAELNFDLIMKTGQSVPQQVLDSLDLVVLNVGRRAHRARRLRIALRDQPRQ